MTWKIWFLLALALPTLGKDPEVEILEPHYLPNQNFKFNITLKRAAYVYVFNLDVKTGHLLQIWPTQGVEHTKWSPGSHIFPKQDLVLYSEEPGMEHFLVVTSPHPLNLRGAHSGDGGQIQWPLTETLILLEDRKIGVTELDIFISNR